MPLVVIDASVALKWFIPEPDSDRALLLRASELCAPDLLLVEAGNALRKAVRRGLLARSDAEAAFATLHASRIRWFASGDLSPEALKHALDLDHTIYDCIYLALARRLDTVMVTSDEGFIRKIAANATLTGSAVGLDAALISRDS
jgi:predicted nucleic acid-binding protein